MKILVLNCGSSSIKYQLIDMGNSADLLAKGLVDRIGLPKGELSHKNKEGKTKTIEQAIANHTEGIDMILSILLDAEFGVIKNLNEIYAVGHRVAHGGDHFTKSAKITDEVKKDIEKCIELAPLHNPANLKGIESMEKLLPNIPQVAVFDTSFHQTMPAHAYLYGIPYELYETKKIRRYGFHGTSHKYVAQKACDILGIDFHSSKIVTCHLGNGASIAAIKNGESIDTSMGFTPVEGLIMGTRCGDIDAGLVLYLMERENCDCKKVNNLLNKESGLRGISGISSDMRDIHQAEREGNERATLALDTFAYRVKKYIGSYAFAMGGVDLVIFTGGIGENSLEMRARICKDLEGVGIEIDSNRNNVRGNDAVISKDGSKVKVMAVTTNEELVIATDTLRIVS